MINPLLLAAIADLPIDHDIGYIQERNRLMQESHKRKRSKADRKRSKKSKIAAKSRKRNR